MDQILLRMKRMSRRVPILAILSLCACQGAVPAVTGGGVLFAGGRTKPDVVLQALTAADSVTATLEFEVVTDAVVGDPSQGRATHDCTLVRSDGQVVSRCVIRREEAIQYRPPSTPGLNGRDFASGDGTEDLIVWNHIATRVYSDDTGAEKVLDTESLRVSPLGRVRLAGVHRMLTRYSPEYERNAWPTVNPGLLALGRGYSAELGQVLNVVEEGPLLRVTATTKTGPSIWSLLVEPSSLLVVQAELTSPQGSVAYSISTAPDGTSGSYRRASGLLPIDATLTSSAGDVDQEWIALVRHEMSDPAPDSEYSRP